MTARPRRKATNEAARRTRHLIALDAENVMTRLRSRQAEMVELFSRLRTRAPMLETVATWFRTVPFAELSRLTPAEQTAVNAFHQVLDELRWYVEYTEDMPSQVHHKLSTFARLLEEKHRALVLAIGPVDAKGAPVVDAEVVRPPRRK